LDNRVLDIIDARLNHEAMWVSIVHVPKTDEAKYRAINAITMNECSSFIKLNT